MASTARGRKAILPFAVLPRPYNPAVPRRGPLPDRDARRAHSAVRPAGCRPYEEASVNALLPLSRAIDALTERIGRFVYWLILAVVADQRGQRERAQGVQLQLATPTSRSSGTCSRSSS